jgi:protease-4
VSDGRKIKKDILREIADGRIFTGRQALANKLVDELGDYEQAVKTTARLSGIKGRPNVTELKPDASDMFKMLSSSFNGMIQGKKSLNIVETPAGRIEGNYSPVLYMVEY